MSENQDRTPLRWSEVSIIVAIIVPVVMVAVGWGVLYERVDNTVQAQAELLKTVQDQGAILAHLNITIVKLSDAIDRLAVTDSNKRER